MSGILSSAKLDRELRSLPPDPTFPLSAYRRTSLLLRSGLMLATVLFAGGLLAYLLENPSLTLDDVIARNPLHGPLNPGSIASELAGGLPEGYMTLAILILLATTIGRVMLAGFELFRGHERTLAWLTVAVVVLLLFGLLVVGPLVQ